MMLLDLIFFCRCLRATSNYIYNTTLYRLSFYYYKYQKIHASIDVRRIQRTLIGVTQCNRLVHVWE
jgi:hypothetical protein